MSEDRAISHLEVLRQDARDEVKKRIEQRDKYSIQLAIILTAIVGVALSRSDLALTLLAAPLASSYYTVLILYSYRVHKVLARYLRKRIEPALAERCGIPLDIEWETFYKTQHVPGIRRTFFLVEQLVVTIGSLTYVGIAQGATHGKLVATFTAIYILLSILITVYFWKDK